ncbi:MAG: hypothetical protein NTU62_11270 [Spirochaetes bacterium]|nr:hypothetical protein [Spirochaetota bacterium]
MKSNYVPNRIFLGYPWNPYKPMWEAVVADLHKQYPVHFLAIGREQGQPAGQLLLKVMKGLDSSSAAIFDASTGNANVSLEYGFFRATRDEDNVFLFLDEDAKVPSGSPIISDLAGSIANKYRPTDNRLKGIVKAICEQHSYVKRFNKFCRQRKYGGGTKRFLLRIIRHLDGRDSILRRELIDDLIHETKKDEKYLTQRIKDLHEGGLITITRGNEYSSRIHISG